MASGLRLQQRHRLVVEGLAQDHLPGVDVWAYGSRVNGQSHAGSDLDLVLRGPTLAEIPSLQLGAFCEALQESTLPFLVEARDWARLPDRFHAEIRRNYVALASKTTGWRSVTLGDCATLVRDSVMPSACTDLPYIGLEHIGRGTLSLNDVGSAREVESMKTAFRAGDILFGKLRPYFRKVVRPRFDGICSTDIWVIRPEENVDAGFLFYMLASPKFVDFASQGAEGTRMPRAKWEQASRFSVHLPPVSEQRAIGRALDAMDDKIRLNRRMAATLEATVQAFYRARFLRIDVASDPGWAKTAVGEVCDIYGGTTPSTKVSDYWYGGSHCWVTPKDLAGLSTSILTGTARRITDAGLDQIPSGLLPKGTVLLSSRAPIGYLAIADMPVSVNQGFIAMVPRALSSFYLLNWCRFHQEDILAVANGSTFLEVTKRNFRNLSILVPTTEAMSAFDRYSEAAYELVAGTLRESVRLESLREALLPKFMSGEIRIPDAEKIVGAAT